MSEQVETNPEQETPEENTVAPYEGATEQQTEAPDINTLREQVEGYYRNNLSALQEKHGEGFDLALAHPRIAAQQHIALLQGAHQQLQSVLPGLVRNYVAEALQAQKGVDVISKHIPDLNKSPERVQEATRLATVYREMYPKETTEKIAQLVAFTMQQRYGAATGSSENHRLPMMGPIGTGPGAPTQEPDQEVDWGKKMGIV